MKNARIEIDDVLPDQYGDLQHIYGCSLSDLLNNLNRQLAACSDEASVVFDALTIEVGKVICDLDSCRAASNEHGSPIQSLQDVHDYVRSEGLRRLNDDLREIDSYHNRDVNQFTPLLDSDDEYARHVATNFLRDEETDYLLRCKSRREAFRMLLSGLQGAHEEKTIS